MTLVYLKPLSAVYVPQSMNNYFAIQAIVKLEDGLEFLCEARMYDDPGEFYIEGKGSDPLSFHYKLGDEKAVAQIVTWLDAYLGRQ